MSEITKKTHWKEIKGTAYMGEWSLQEGEERTVTIKSIGQEDVPSPTGAVSRKYVLHFEEEALGMVVSAKVVLEAIAKVCGSPYAEDWIGHKITLYKEYGKWFGKAGYALRVRDEAPSDMAVCEECGSPIKPQNGMSSAQIASYTKSKYGKALCSECATKAKEAKEAK